MAELQPLVDVQINSGVDVPQVVPPTDTAAVNPPKRQRKPSVRLGDIGDQNTYANQRKTKQHQWKFGSKDSKSSKTRPLVNLTTTGAGGAFPGEFQLSGEDKGIGNENYNNINNGGGNCNNSNGLIGSWKAARVCSNSKEGFSGTKRVRSNWGSKMEEGDEKFHNVDVYDYNSNNDNDNESLNFSMDNETDDLNYDGEDRGKEVRVRVSDGPSDTDGRNWNNNNNSNPERNGVRVWLNQLGLGRYASVFEVHEVDDEVLPLLTLEDLKDMGISAVGSRRKLFCSIQKLGKGFS